MKTTSASLLLLALLLGTSGASGQGAPGGSPAPGYMPASSTPAADSGSGSDSSNSRSGSSNSSSANSPAANGSNGVAGNSLPGQNNPNAPGGATNGVNAANSGGEFNSHFYTTSNYVLHPTDLIEVDVVDDRNASSTARVDIDGTVQLTYLDKPILVGNLTVGQAKDKIKAAYIAGQIYVKPEIQVIVREYRERAVEVTGQVGRPGPVPIPPSRVLTLTDAVIQAGGHTRISSHTVSISRTMPDGTSKQFYVNLYDAYKDPKKDVEVQDGDKIYVGEDPIGW